VIWRADDTGSGASSVGPALPVECGARAGTGAREEEAWKRTSRRAMKVPSRSTRNSDRMPAEARVGTSALARRFQRRLGTISLLKTHGQWKSAPPQIARLAVIPTDSPRTLILSTRPFRLASQQQRTAAYGRNAASCPCSPLPLKLSTTPLPLILRMWRLMSSVCSLCRISVSALKLRGPLMVTCLTPQISSSLISASLAQAFSPK